MKGTVITHRGGRFGRDKLYAAVIVGETKTQWKACMLDDDGKETSREIRLTKRTMTEVGKPRSYWHAMPQDFDLQAALAEEQEKDAARRAEQEAKSAQRQARIEQAKAALRLSGFVSEELGLYKAECNTPRNGLVVMVFTVENRESLYGEPGVTLSVTGYYKTSHGVSGGGTTANGPTVIDALANYLTGWHWD